MLLGYSDSELGNMGGYDLVHHEDLMYVASAHQECKSDLQHIFYRILYMISIGFNFYERLETFCKVWIFFSAEDWSIGDDSI